VIIPAYNPEEKIIALVEGIQAFGLSWIVIVDDGSSKACDSIFSKLRGYGCEILTHVRNRGKGAALKTGVHYVLSACPDTAGFVTADADGQHLPEDIYRLARMLEEAPTGMILGVRCFEGEGVPFKSKWGNRVTSWVFFLKTGVRLSDTQTGLRAMPADFAALYTETGGDRFEFEMNVLLSACKQGIPLLTAPIHTVYTENNRSSHFHSVRDSARIYWNLFNTSASRRRGGALLDEARLSLSHRRRRSLTPSDGKGSWLSLLKFGCASGISAALDFGLFIAIFSFIFGQSAKGVVISTVLARLISGLSNFLMNRFIVFAGKTNGVFMKYVLLFLAQMLISAQLTAVITEAGLFAPISKLIVDSGLWILSFFIQKNYIFRQEKI
jgi:glycosyltransferase involved in cell wall biosynthesis